MSASEWLTDFKSGSPNAPNAARLPQGWEQGFDSKSGKIYYFNRQTQQSSWDVPQSDIGTPQSQPINRGGSNQGVQRDSVQQRGGNMQQGVPARSVQQQGVQQVQRDMPMQQRGVQGDQSSSAYGNRGKQNRMQENEPRGYPAATNDRSNMEDEDRARRGKGFPAADRYGNTGGQYGGGDRGGDRRGGDDRGNRGWANESKPDEGEKGGRPSWGNYESRGGKDGGKDGGKAWGKDGGKGDRGGRGGDSWEGGGRSREGPIGGGRDTRYEGSNPRSRPQRDEWEEQEPSTGVVSIARQDYEDDNLPGDKQFGRRLANCEEMNLAENFITGNGLTWLLRDCKNFPHLRVVKLHKCRIGDSAASCLVKICRNAPALNEMHLSHNQLTWAGADKIVPAACERQTMKNVENREPTLWLRLEHNQIEDAKGLFNDWQRRGLMVSMYHKSDKHTPHGVVLPYFLSQHTEQGREFQRAERQSQQWEATAWAGGGVDKWSGHRAAAAEWWPDEGWAAAAAWKGAGAGWKGEQAWSWAGQEWPQKGKGKGGKAAPQAVEDWGTAKSGKGGKAKEEKPEGKKEKTWTKVKSGEEKEAGEAKNKRAGAGGASSNKGLTDDNLEEFCKKRASEEGRDNSVLDIANNKLSGAGFSAFQDLCLALADLSIVKLHKNLLTDAAAPALAEICRKCPCLKELHLSHNLITRTGADQIVAAACEARRNDDEEALPPLWLRLEHNEVEEPQTLIDDWKERDLPVSVYSKGNSRHNRPKGVHMPFFTAQGKPSGYTHGEAAGAKEPKQKWQETSWEEDEEWTAPAKGKKQPHQVKWKPVGPKVEQEEVGKEEKAETDDEEEKTAEGEAADEKEEKAEEQAADTVADDNKEEEATEEKKAATGEKEDTGAKRRTRRERRSAEDEDGKEGTAFSSGEESAGSE